MNNQAKQSKRGIGKRGESLWISFVLLMGFVVVLSLIVNYWLVDFVKSSGKDVTKVVYNYELCDSISLSLEDVCSQGTNLYFNVSNRNDLRINALVVRAFDPTGLPQTVERNITIKPGNKREIQLNLNISNVSNIEAVPIMYKDKMIIICTERKATAQSRVC